jgi:hypothetical protein
MLVSSTVVAFPNGGWNVARLDVILLFGNLAILTAGAGRLTLPILMGWANLNSTLKPRLWRKFAIAVPIEHSSGTFLDFPIKNRALATIYNALL